MNKNELSALTRLAEQVSAAWVIVPNVVAHTADGHTYLPVVQLYTSSSDFEYFGVIFTKRYGRQQVRLVAVEQQIGSTSLRDHKLYKHELKLVWANIVQARFMEYYSGSGLGMVDGPLLRAGHWAVRSAVKPSNRGDLFSGIRDSAGTQMRKITTIDPG